MVGNLECLWEPQGACEVEQGKKEEWRKRSIGNNEGTESVGV